MNQTAWDTSGPSTIAPEFYRSKPRNYAGTPHHSDKPRGKSVRLSSLDRHPAGRPMIDIDLAELLEFYRVAGRTYADCAKHWNCSTYTIGKRLRAAGKSVGSGNYERG